MENLSFTKLSNYAQCCIKVWTPQCTVSDFSRCLLPFSSFLGGLMGQGAGVTFLEGPVCRPAPSEVRCLCGTRGASLSSVGVDEGMCRSVVFTGGRGVPGSLLGLQGRTLDPHQNPEREAGSGDFSEPFPGGEVAAVRCLGLLSEIGQCRGV